MKKVFLSLLILFNLSILNAREFDLNFLENIEEKYLGVYLPVNFIETLQNTKNFTVSLMANNYGNGRNRLYHDILIVDKSKYRIWSNARFHDGYAIPFNEAEYYKFIERDNKILIIDNKGYEYIKISQNIENAYEFVDRFIAEIIFADALKNKKILLENNYVIIAETGLKYTVLLTQFVEGNPNLLLSGNRQVLFLEIVDGKYFFFDAIRLNPMEFGKGNNIIYEF
jgi:hypothetical protein